MKKFSKRYVRVIDKLLTIYVNKFLGKIIEKSWFTKVLLNDILIM